MDFRTWIQYLILQCRQENFQLNHWKNPFCNFLSWQTVWHYKPRWAPCCSTTMSEALQEQFCLLLSAMKKPAMYSHAIYLMYVFSCNLEPRKKPCSENVRWSWEPFMLRVQLSDGGNGSARRTSVLLLGCGGAKKKKTVVVFSHLCFCVFAPKSSMWERRLFLTVFWPQLGWLSGQEGLTGLPLLVVGELDKLRKKHPLLKKCFLDCFYCVINDCFSAMFVFKVDRLLHCRSHITLRLLEDQELLECDDSTRRKWCGPKEHLPQVWCVFFLFCSF